MSDAVPQPAPTAPPTEPAPAPRRWDLLPKLRWFGAEILIVVAGVLIALALNAWWQGRQTAAEERVVLEELHRALEDDRRILTAQLDAFRDKVRLMNLLAAHLEQQAPYADTLDAYFGAVYGLGIVSVNASPYESLKSRGTGLISDATLRSDVTRLYDLRYDLLDEIHQTQRSAVLDVMRPYFLTHFEDLVFNVSATPASYEDVLNDLYFRNLMAYRREIVVTAEIPFYEQTIEEVSALLTSIEAALAP